MRLEFTRTMTLSGDTLGQAGLSDSVSHESEGARKGLRIKGKGKKTGRPRGKTTTGTRWGDWRQERNRLIRGIKLVSNLNELSDGEDGVTEGSMTLGELVFKQKTRQEKRRKQRDVKKPRVSLFLVTKEKGLEEVRAEAVKILEEGRKEARHTLMTGEQLGESRVEEHFAVIKKRLLQLNRDKFCALLSSLPKNRPPTQQIVNRALDQLEGPRRSKLLSQYTVRPGDSLLEEGEEDDAIMSVAGVNSSQASEASPKRSTLRIPASVKKGINKVKFIAALKVMKKKRSREQVVEEPPYSKPRPPLDLSAIVEKAAPDTPGNWSGGQAVGGEQSLFEGDLRFRDFNRTRTSADLVGEIVSVVGKTENELPRECGAEVADEP